MGDNEKAGDKRAFERTPERVDIEVKQITYPLKKGPGERGDLQNVAEGGIGFTVSTPFEPGTLLEARIHIFGWQRFKRSYSKVIDDAAAVAPLTAVGEVVWCHERPGGQGYEVGLKFKDIYEDDYQAMKKYIEQIR